jgi:pimeloyl-ACP methyl ester carboxylesterase
MPSPCILLPGFDGSGRLFAPLLAESLGPLDPLVLALPSDAPLGYAELVEWVEPRLPDQPCVVLAESFSGPLAIRLALRNPGRVSRLILAATFLRSPLSPWLAPFGVLALPFLFARPPPAIAVRALLAGRDAPAPLVDAIRDAMAELPAGVATARARAALTADEEAAFARVTAPTLWIRATADRLLRAGHVADVRVARPDTQVVAVDGPHTILQRRPRQCAAAIAAFLAG